MRIRAPWLAVSITLAALIAGRAAAAAPAATPPGATDLETSVGRMARIGFSASPVFSPDGSRIAFVSNLSGVPQVWMVATAGGWPELITPFDDPVSGVRWSPDGAWLAVSAAPGGGLNEQLYLLRPDGRDLTRLTDGSKVTSQLGAFSHDGRWLAIGSNREQPASITPYLYDLASRVERRVAAPNGLAGLTDVSRDDRYGVLSRLVSRGDDDLFLVDLASGKEVALTPHTPPGAFGGGVFSPDGRTVYLSSNKDRDRVAFARVAIGDGGRPGPIEVIAARDDAELEGFEITEDGTTAALVWDVAGRSELAFLDLPTGRQTAGPKLPGEIAGGLAFSRDGKLLALAISGARQPSDVWVLDRASGSLRQLTHSPHAGVDLAALAAPELVRFTARDGLALSGWLYRPPGGGPGPVVISFHGGPEGQERPAFNSGYQALVAHGIGVFAPNVRGSSGFGKRFVNLDNGALRVEGVHDIKDCVDYLVRERIADPRRIGIMGGSYGGYMVMAGLTEYPELFAAGADSFGIVNFETFFSHTEPWMAAISKVEYGDPDTQKEMLRALSPIHKLDRVKAPTLVLHGANDTNVPVVEAEQVVSTLKARGVPVEYVLFPDEGHGFRKTANRIRASVAIVRFFSERLAAPAGESARTR